MIEWNPKMDEMMQKGKPNTKGVVILVLIGLFALNLAACQSSREPVTFKFPTSLVSLAPSELASPTLSLIPSETIPFVPTETPSLESTPTESPSPTISLEPSETPTPSATLNETEIIQASYTLTSKFNAFQDANDYQNTLSLGDQDPHPDSDSHRHTDTNPTLCPAAHPKTRSIF